MFDLFNVNVGNQEVYPQERLGRSGYTGTLSTHTGRVLEDKYELFDGDYWAIDKDYLDYLLSCDAVDYQGMEEDTYGNPVYRYILR